MSHEIFGKRFGYAERSAPGWHKIGSAIPEGTLPYEFSRQIGMFIPVEKRSVPVTVRLQEADGSFRFEDVTDTVFALIRGMLPEDPREILWGSVDANREVIPNEVMAEALSSWRTDSMRPDCAGVLFEGKRSFWTLEGDSLSVALGNGKDDAVKTYFIVDHDVYAGNTSFILSPIRVVCWNTLSAASSYNKLLRVNVRHTGADAVKRVCDVIAMFTKLSARQAALAEAFSNMAHTPISREEFEQGLETAIPVAAEPGLLSLFRATSEGSLAANVDAAMLKLASPEKIAATMKYHQNNVDRAEALRDAVRKVYAGYQSSPEDEGLFGNYYGFVNAVADISGWAGAGKRVQRASVFGDRSIMIDRAFAFANSAVAGDLEAEEDAN